MTEFTNSNSANQTTATIDPAAPKLEIKRFYVKEQSCKVPHAPGIFNVEGTPETQVEISNHKYKQDNGEIDVILKLNITLKLNQQTALNLHVEQVGTFILQNFNAEQEHLVLGTYCLSLLFPYARKIVADLSMSAGFVAINLPPVNFDQMYLQQQEQAKKQAKQPLEPATVN